MKKVLPFSGQLLLGGLFFLFPLFAFAEAPAPADQAKFDNDAALRFSQGVIDSTVGNYEFRDSDGSVVTLEQYRGKPLIISLLYTSCYNICPLTTRHLLKVVNKAKDVLGKDSFNIITIGFDTYRDTPEAMRTFAQYQGVSRDDWRFLAANPQTIDSLVKELGFLYFKSSSGFDHLVQASILDGEGKVYRQIYGINFETPHLIEPLKELVFGHPQKKKTLVSDLGRRIRLFCTVYDPALDRYVFDYSIFVGLFVGLSIGSIMIFFLIREWRYSLRSK